MEETAKQMHLINIWRECGDLVRYKIDELGMSISYPSTFSIDNSLRLRDSGHYVSFYNKLLSSPMNIGISVFSWTDINDPAINVAWKNEGRYRNFHDFLNDSRHTYMNVIGETTIDDTKAYILSMPGDMGYESIMFERKERFFRIGFPWEQRCISDDVREKILSSIRFTE